MNGKDEDFYKLLEHLRRKVEISLSQAGFCWIKAKRIYEIMKCNGLSKGNRHRDLSYAGFVLQHLLDIYKKREDVKVIRWSRKSYLIRKVEK